MTNEHSHNHFNNDIRVAFFLNFGFAIAEIIGGLMTNSVAILADALHDLGDSFSLALSWRLENLSEKAEDEKFSYGYKRFSMLGAIISALILIVGSVVVLSESIKRLLQPQLPDAQGMLLFAIAGIAINGYAAIRTSRGKNLNARIISWHLIEDVLGWLAVLIVSLVLLLTEVAILDPILSIIFTLFVLSNVGKYVKRTVVLFMQGVPEDLDLKTLENAIREINMVADIHHLHAWSLDGEKHVLTLHLKLCDDTKNDDVRVIKDKIRFIAKQFGFIHTTVEIEFVEDDCSMGISQIKEVL